MGGFDILKHSTKLQLKLQHFNHALTMFYISNEPPKISACITPAAKALNQSRFNLLAMEGVVTWPADNNQQLS